MPKGFMEELERHTHEEETRFDAISSRLDTVMQAVERIRDNHLAHVASDLGSLKSDVGWLKWGVMLLIGAACAQFFTGK